MWILTNKGLLSVVADRDDPDRLLVRARQKGLLEELLGRCEVLQAHIALGDYEIKVFEDQTADYPYRVFMHREPFTYLIESEAEHIDYTNFKNSVKDDRLHALYMRVWGILGDGLGFGNHYRHGGRRG